MKTIIPTIEKGEVIFLDDLNFESIDKKLEENPIIFGTKEVTNERYTRHSD